MNKVIYLKSLVKNFKPKTETFPKDIIQELEKMGIDLIQTKKPKDLQADKLAGRSFILNHTEEFLTQVFVNQNFLLSKNLFHEHYLI